MGEVNAVIAEAEGDPDGDLGTQTNVPLEAYCKDFASLWPCEISASIHVEVVYPAYNLDYISK